LHEEAVLRVPALQQGQQQQQQQQQQEGRVEGAVEQAVRSFCTEYGLGDTACDVTLHSVQTHLRSVHLGGEEMLLPLLLDHSATAMVVLDGVQVDVPLSMWQVQSINSTAVY
jgi:hypothetical protein